MVEADKDWDGFLPTTGRQRLPALTVVEESGLAGGVDGAETETGGEMRHSALCLDGGRDDPDPLQAGHQQTPITLRLTAYTMVIALGELAKDLFFKGSSRQEVRVVSASEVSSKLALFLKGEGRDWSGQVSAVVAEFTLGAVKLAYVVCSAINSFPSKKYPTS